MKAPSSSDWFAFIKKHAASCGEEFDLRELLDGDHLRVITQNSIYDFAMQSSHTATLHTGRDDRPSGLVHLMGCSFGHSSSIKPHHLFCGGNLRFTFKKGKMTHTTSRIRAIQRIHRSKNPRSPVHT